MGRRSIVTVKVTSVEKRRSPSKHYVYVIRVTWSDGITSTVYRRYSRFFDFQNDLLDKFPHQAGKDDPGKRILPFLPGKKFFGRSHIREVAEKRLKPIDEYCQSLIKLPSEIAESEEVLEFFEVDPEDIEPIKHRQSSRKPKGVKISGPKLLEQYVALADYAPQGKGEIPLRQGVSIEVAEKTETGWWFVTADDEQGWVPSTYLQRVDGREELSTSVPGQEEEYVCTTPFTPDGPDEIGLEIGTLVLVLEKNLQGWWKVRLNNQEGFVPAAYLSKVKPDKVTSVQQGSNRLSQGVQVVSSLSEVSEYFKTSSSQKSSVKKQPPPRTNSLPKGSGPFPSSPLRRVREYVTIDSFGGDAMGDGICFSAGQSVKVLEKSPSGWWYVEIEGQEGWAPAAYIQQLPETPDDGEGASDFESVNSHATPAATEDVFDKDLDSDSTSTEEEEEEEEPQPSNMAALQNSLVAKLGEKKGGVSRPLDTPPAPPVKPSGAPVKPQAPPKLSTTSSSKPKPPGNKPVVNRSADERAEKEEDFDNAAFSEAANPKVNDLANSLKAKFEQSGNGSSVLRKPKPSPPAKSFPPSKASIVSNNWKSSKPEPPSKPNNWRSSKPEPPSKPNNWRSSKPEPPSKPNNWRHSRPEPASVSQEPSPATPKQLYRASAGFLAENSGEVNLQKGSHVSVVQTDDSGWWLVESEGLEGWAPASFLEPVENRTPFNSSDADTLTADSPQSNSLMNEISNKFGAKLKPVAKPVQSPGSHTNGNANQSPSSALLPPGKKPTTGSVPALPIKPKGGAASKGRLPPIPPQKPS